MFHAIFAICTIMLNVIFVSHRDDSLESYSSRHKNYLVKIFKHNNIKTAKTIEMTVGGSMISSVDNLYIRSDDQFLVSQAAQQSASNLKFEPYFYCRNKDFYFELANNSSGKKTVVNRVFPAPSVPECIAQISKEFVRESCLKKFGHKPMSIPKITPIMQFYYLNIDAIVGLPEFKLNSIAKTNDGTIVDFEYCHYDGVSKKHKATGSIILDELKDCRFKKLLIECNDDKYYFKLLANAEMRDISGLSEETVINSLKTVIVNGKEDVTGYKEKLVTTVNSVKDSDFMLSTYGLADPVGANSGVDLGVPWFVYLTLIGAICLTIAIVFTRKNRQES